jgi:hypothetical protein
MLYGLCAAALSGCVAHHPAPAAAGTPQPSPIGCAPLIHPHARTAVRRWSDVAIHGRNLSQVALVKVGGQHVLFAKKSDSALIVTVGAWPGEVVLFSPCGEIVVGYVDVLPEIQWFQPEVGAAGTKVEITGWGLYDVRSVTFNGVPATFWVHDLGGPNLGASRIIALAPSSTGSGNIAVTTRAGRAEFDSPFRILDSPVSAQQMQQPPKLHCAGTVTSYQANGAPIPLFAPLVAPVQRQTCVPVRLPTVIEQGWFAVISPYTDANSYDINLTANKSCNRGAHVCTGWIITGEYAGSHPAPLPGRPVLLADGTTAYYERYRIFAYSSNETVTWRKGEFQYSIAERYPRQLKALLAAANSMTLYSSRARL